MENCSCNDHPCVKSNNQTVPLKFITPRDKKTGEFTGYTIAIKSNLENEIRNILRKQIGTPDIDYRIWDEIRSIIPKNIKGIVKVQSPDVFDEEIGKEEARKKLNINFCKLMNRCIKIAKKHLNRQSIEIQNMLDNLERIQSTKFKVVTPDFHTCSCDVCKCKTKTNKSEVKSKSSLSDLIKKVISKK